MRDLAENEQGDPEEEPDVESGPDAIEEKFNAP